MINTRPTRLRTLARSICVLVTAAAASNAAAATLPAGFRETLVANGIANATAMQFAPDGRLFVCEQGGSLRVIKNGVLRPTPFVSLTVDSNGERGLLGVAVDPNFSLNQFVYVYYTATTPAVHNRISRFTANGDVAAAGSEQVLLDLDTLSQFTNHNGGALAFGPDGKLYASVGENATASNSQTLSNLLGKMLRINPDGTIPTDNPFYGTATGRNRAIWALGLRNPFTFAFNRNGSRMFINDVGETSWEEIDDGIAGANYGWPVVEGPLPANQPYTYPRYWYDHSQNNGGCAITGGAFYDSPTSQFPLYTGQYFFADLCRGWIRRLDPATNQAVTFATGINLPVDLKVGTDGALYYLARGAGAVFRISSTATADSVTPASGSGTVQTFALKYSDTIGAGNLATLVAWFSPPVLSTVNSCFAYYETSSGLVFLLNDAGTAWTSGVRGSNTVIQNSQCAIQLASTTVTGLGTMLTMNLAVTFKAAYAGPKTTFMLAGNFNGTTSGWQARGMWTVPGGITPPTADGVMPPNGSGPSQTFALRYSDPAGSANLSALWVWFTDAWPPSVTNTCVAAYEPATNSMRMYNDNATAFAVGSLGAPYALQNSQCAINLAATTVTAGANSLTLNLRVTFKAAFVGSKWIAMYASNYSGANSDWQIRGSWTVTAAAVTADSVTPSSGSGAVQTFALQYSDNAGSDDLRNTWVWFTTTFGSTANTCVVYYERTARVTDFTIPSDRVYLANDGGSMWLSGLRGSAAILQNSQCAIDLAATTVTAVGNVLTLNLRVTFKPAFAGSKRIFMYADATSGPNSNWQTRGSWIVP